MKLQKVELQGNPGFRFAVTVLVVQFFIVFPAIQFFFRTHPWLPQYYDLIYYAGIIAFLLASRKISTNELGFSTRFLGQHLLIGSLAGGLLLAALPLLDVLVSVSGLDQHELFQQNRQLIEGEPEFSQSLRWAIPILLIPLIKQTFFSGIIFQALLKKWNPVIAVYVLAVIFTLAHFKLNLGLFLLGIISAFLLRWTGTLYASILFHISCAVAGVLLVQFYPRLITLVGFLF